MVHLGQVDAEHFPDVGLAAFNGEKIPVKVISGSIFDGVVTDKIFHVAEVCRIPLSLNWTCQ